MILIAIVQINDKAGSMRIDLNAETMRDAIAEVADIISAQNYDVTTIRIEPGPVCIS